MSNVPLYFVFPYPRLAIPVGKDSGEEFGYMRKIINSGLDFFFEKKEGDPQWTMFAGLVISTHSTSSPGLVDKLIPTRTRKLSLVIAFPSHAGKVALRRLPV